VTAPAALAPVAALERLATALGPELTTTLVSGTGRRPRLTVCARSGSAVEDVYADGSQYWWGWGEPIAGTADPLTAARRVTAALRGSTLAGSRQ
jgi:hypothetical protein